MPSDDLRDLLESFSEPAILLSDDYEILLANSTYRATYGFSDRDTRRHRCYAVSHRYSVPCDKAGESCPLKASRETGEISRVLHVHHTPTGEEYVNVEMWPIHAPDGSIRFYIERMSPSMVASAESDSARLVGKSLPFQHMLQMVERVAPSETSVLLLGESGTGKELVAQTLHRLSQRSDGPFVPVECSGMPDTLLESELFGYVRGAFTGADQDKPGLIEAAAGGTLFLDEVGDIPLSVQVKLLRLLESRRFRRVGATDWQEADFRLIAATNRDLHAQVAAGEFREDLYYRLGVFEIDLPPLRERRDDLPALIDTLLDRLGAGKVRFSEAAMACLGAYEFPGNVRELRNIVERAVLLADDGVVHPSHLPRQCQGPDSNPAANEVLTLEEAEQRYLQQVMARHDGDRRSLADKLGVSERVLYRKLAALKSS